MAVYNQHVETLAVALIKANRNMMSNLTLNRPRSPGPRSYRCSFVGNNQRGYAGLTMAA